MSTTSLVTTLTRKPPKVEETGAAVSRIGQVLRFKLKRRSFPILLIPSLLSVPNQFYRLYTGLLCSLCYCIESTYFENKYKPYKLYDGDLHAVGWGEGP